MSIPAQQPILTPAPMTYDQNVFASWVQQFEVFFKMLNNRGPVLASTLRLTNLPTSASGLPSGSVWHDTGDNTLKIVP